MQVPALSNRGKISFPASGPQSSVPVTPCVSTRITPSLALILALHFVARSAALGAAHSAAMLTVTTAIAFHCFMSSHPLGLEFTCRPRHTTRRSTDLHSWSPQVAE